MTPLVHVWGEVRWEETRERIDAEWTPLLDEKQREVHGYAIVSETPADMLGRTMDWHNSRLMISTLPFEVTIIATRSGQSYGASQVRCARYATRDLALAHARRSLAQQGKRYAKKYGAP